MGAKYYGGERLLITGDTGFLGRAVMRALPPRFEPPSFEVYPKSVLDLRRPYSVVRIAGFQPTHIIHLAAPTPGGLGGMRDHPLCIADMARIDANVVEAACAAGTVKQIIAVGSLCAADPFDSINGPYGAAKQFLHALLEAAWREHRIPYTFLTLANLYGPGDRSNHVIPALIRKILKAKAEGGEVEVWGDGTDLRAFTYVDDAAAALVEAVGERTPSMRMPGPQTLVPIGGLVQDLATRLAYHGDIRYNAAAPSLRRDYTALPQLWLSPCRTFWGDGLEATCAWWIAHPDPAEPEVVTQP